MSVDADGALEAHHGWAARDTEDPDSDRTLVEAFTRRRDELSFRALYRRHSPFLYAVARRTVGGSDRAAEELLQDTWVRAVTRLDTFQWKSRFRTWLVGIMYNCWREHLRKRQRHTAKLSHTDSGGLPGTRDRPDLIERLDLEDALDRLPDGYREVVVLHYLYGYRHTDIASLLGISVGTSKSQASRGIERLRSFMNPQPRC